MPLEPGRYAVRRDLAEIAVADRIFAQHYVEPMPVTLAVATDIRARPGSDAAVVASLAAGDRFLVLDLGHQWVWGRADRDNTIGYVTAASLQP